MTEKEIIQAYKQIAQKKRDAKRAIRIAKIQEISKGNKELNIAETYPIILADPPWHYSFGNEERNIQINYPTMSHEDICNLPVSKLATANALLFLWATSPKLHEAMDVLKSWGFEYKTCAVWVKNRPITGYYFRAQHELLLIGTKGSGIPTPRPADRPVSIIPGLVREHSQKPDELYDIIEKMYPELTKIELFARSKRAGWAAWGNQVE
jgi:N6-adenosine-specific RNA methylase IME4